MKKHYGIIVYYLVLLVVLFAWTSASAAPPMWARIGFLIAVIAPSFVNKVPLMFAYIVFFTITSYGATYSYMPTSLYLYAAIAFLFYAFKIRFVGESRLTIPRSIFVLFILSFLVNLIASGTIKNITWSLLIVMLLAPLLNKDKKSVLQAFSLSFQLVSLALSIMFLVIGDQYTQAYNYESELERSTWIDPNYFSCVVGMGAMISLCELFTDSTKTIKRVLDVVIIGLSLYTMVSVASRGGLLAFVVGFALLLLFSRAKWIYKILFLGLAAAFIWWMYSSSVFELLTYRIAEDDQGGSGRLGIWGLKLSAFFNEGNIFNYLFGIGFDNTMVLGTNIKKGIHNDYIAFLIEYGIIGLSLFLAMLFAPIRRIKEKKHLTYVLALTFYLATCVFTLEPLTLGIMCFYLFYIYIFYYSQYDEKLSCFANEK